MSKDSIQVKIRANPKFAEMVGKRTRLAIALSLIVLVPYYTFMLLTSLKPGLFTTTISDTSVITIGWPIAAPITISAPAYHSRCTRSKRDRGAPPISRAPARNRQSASACSG